jgi:LacI family transcriptional regulator
MVNMHKKRVTISDIAKAAGVDKSTVSIVLNNKPLAKRVKQETKDRIVRIANEFNYNPSFAARSLSSGKTKTLGIVVGDIARIYFSELTAAALEAAYKRGYQMLVSVTQWDLDKEREALQTLLERQPDGIIFCPGGLSCFRGPYDQIVALHYPVVACEYEDAGASSVMSDYEPGMEDAIKQFIKNGHKEIGYVGSSIEWNNKQDTLDALTDKYGIKLKKYIFPEHTPEIMRGLANDLIQPEQPKALIVAADESALLLIAALQDFKKKVPEDFDIIGIDGIDWGANSRPALTTIEQDKKALMTAAVDMLIEMSNNPGWKPQKIVVPTKLIIRDTVKL